MCNFIPHLPEDVRHDKVKRERERERDAGRGGNSNFFSAARKKVSFQFVTTNAMRERNDQRSRSERKKERNKVRQHAASSKQKEKIAISREGESGPPESNPIPRTCTMFMTQRRHFLRCPKGLACPGLRESLLWPPARDSHNLERAFLNIFVRV